MTPLARYLSRYLPAAAVMPVLVLVYSLTLFAIVIYLDRNAREMIYLNIGYAR